MMTCSARLLRAILTAFWASVLVFAAVLWLGQLSFAQSILPSDRDASANWKKAGMLSVGGIPNRTTNCATISPKGSGQDDTAAINNAISSCPAGQVVQLKAGTFTIAEGSTIVLNKAVTLRGAGPTATILNRPNGATVGSYFPGNTPSTILRIEGNSASGNTVPLTVDAAQGSNSVQVSNAAGYSIGEIVLLDEASGAGWQPDRVNSGKQVFASPDYRVVWNRHNPAMDGDDGTDIFGYFQVHPDHPTNEMHQISQISGNTITFDSPITISYRVSHGAQLTPMITGPTNAGVEELAVKGGDDANIQFDNAAYAWAKDIDNSNYLNDGFRIESSFRLQLEGVYVHDAVWPVNGGAGYNISIAFGSSELLIENSISMRANKVMVARAAGTGSVIAYNYMDDGFISGSNWVEIGLNASHLVGPHHVLFEGNWGFNADSDQTHGSSIYMTYFRNWLTGFRSKFTDYLTNQVLDDANQSANGPRRAAAAHAYAYWFSYIGNVLGTPGRMSNWTYNCIGGINEIPGDCIWDLGMVDIAPQGWDPTVVNATIQDGNYDYLTNSIHWAANDTAHTLPNSLYLTQKPAFFGAYTWPWVNPTGSSQQLYTLPAKARYDAGTPFPQPSLPPPAAHDFNGDGKSDIALSDGSGNTGVWLMNGVQVTPAGVGAGPAGWSIVGQRDFNGDGKADLLWRDTSGNVGMWFMNGAQATPAGVGAAPAGWSIAGTGDFNGDGKSDILLRDGSGNVAIWFMNGAQVTPAGVGAAPAGWSVAGTGDFNGDGKSDILLQDGSGNVGIWFMNGAQVTPAGVGAMSAGWSIVETGDFDGDGKSDVLLQHTSGNVGIWFMNGAQVTPAGVGSPPAGWSIQRLNVD